MVQYQVRTTKSLHVNINCASCFIDKDTNLMRFGTRDYDPNTRRWAAKDPIDFNGKDTNLYKYVLNDPVNFVDPSGEAWWLAIPIVGGLTSYLNAPNIDEKPKSGMTPLAKATLSCVGGGGVRKSTLAVMPRDGFMHRPHHNFGTRKNPKWQKHIQIQWSKINPKWGATRIPYGKKYPLRHGKELK